MDMVQELREVRQKSSVLTRYFAIAISIYHILYYSGFLDFFIRIPPPVFRSISLACLYTIVFACVPHTYKKPVPKIPWFDVVFIFLSVFPSMYYGLAYFKIITQLGNATPLQQVLGAMLIIATLEAVRRTTSLVLAAITLFFAIYPLTCSYFPSFLYGPGYSFERTIGNLYLFPEGMLGIILDITVTMIIGYVIFGSFLEVSGVSVLFTDLARAMVGRLKSGAALSAVIGSALFGTVSGSGVANVAAVGIVTIPLMKKVGLSPEFAGATEAVASTGGQLMPPVMGAAAFVMADFLEMPYYLVCIAAIVPSLLYYFSLAIGVVFEVDRLQIRRLSKDEIPSLKNIITKQWFNFIPLVVLIFSLIIFHWTPDICVFYALLSLLIIIGVKMARKKDAKEFGVILANGLEKGAIGMIYIIAPVVAAGIIMGSLSLTGLAISLCSDLISFAGGNLIVLGILCAVAATILGMGLPTVTVYIIVALIFAPPLIQLGVKPIAAHMFIFYYGLASMITPPVCLCAYVAAGIAGGDMFKTGYTAMKLGFGAYLIPFIFLLDPSMFLLVGGSVGRTLIAIILSFLGILLVHCGTSGRLRNVLNFNIVERVLLMIAGVFIAIYMQRSLVVFFSSLLVGAVIIGWGFFQQKRSNKLIAGS